MTRVEVEKEIKKIKNEKIRLVFLQLNAFASVKEIIQMLEEYRMEQEGEKNDKYDEG